jgi:hypothetical protein
VIEIRQVFEASDLAAEVQQVVRDPNN